MTTHEEGTDQFV